MICRGVNIPPTTGRLEIIFYEKKKYSNFFRHKTVYRSMDVLTEMSFYHSFDRSGMLNLSLN